MWRHFFDVTEAERERETRNRQCSMFSCFSRRHLINIDEYVGGRERETYAKLLRCHLFCLIRRDWFRCSTQQINQTWTYLNEKTTRKKSAPLQTVKAMQAKLSNPSHSYCAQCDRIHFFCLSPSIDWIWHVQADLSITLQFNEVHWTVEVNRIGQVTHLFPSGIRRGLRRVRGKKKKRLFRTGRFGKREDRADLFVITRLHRSSAIAEFSVRRRGRKRFRRRQIESRRCRRTFRFQSRTSFSDGQVHNMGLRRPAGFSSRRKEEIFSKSQPTSPKKMSTPTWTVTSKASQIESNVRDDEKRKKSVKAYLRRNEFNIINLSSSLA